MTIFPSNPAVGDKVENGSVTYTWDGSKWVSTNGPLVQGSTGPIGATGATGPVGTFDGKTAIVSTNLFQTLDFVASGIDTVGLTTYIDNDGSLRYEGVGVGSDSVVIGPRDGYFVNGNTPGAGPEHANLMFNHFNGAPNVDGNSVRLSVNTSQTTQPARLDLAMASNVSYGTTVNLTRVATFREAEVDFASDVLIRSNLTVDGEIFGNLTGNIDGDVSGNSGTTDRLRVPVNISLAGDVAGTQSFDGSSNITINTTIQPNSVQLATDTTGAFVRNVTVSGVGLNVTGSGENATYNVSSNATSSNVINTIVSRSNTGTFSATRVIANLTGNVTGNADTASQWANARTLTLSGDLGGSVSIDGSSNVTLNATVQPNSVQLATDTTGDFVRRGATSGNGISGSTTGENQIFTVTSNATSTNTPNTIVFRDGSGNFNAGTITANLTGRATQATNSDNAVLSTNVNALSTNNGTNYYVYFGGQSGQQRVRSDAGIRYIPDQNRLTVTNLNSTTVTATNVNATNISGTVTGNADTASALTPGANINGVLFTGASNITITANTPQSLSPGNFILGSAFNGGTARTWDINATPTNTPNTIVSRNSSGDFTARNVNGSNLVSSGEVRAGNGAVGDPSITFGSDLDLGIYRIAANVGGLTAGALEAARWDTVRFGVGLTQNRYLQIGAGNQNDTNLRIYKRDNNVSDHIQFYNGTTRIGEIGAEDDTWLRINQETNKNILTPRMIRADGGFQVDGSFVISATGVHQGNGSGLTNLNASSISSGTIGDAFLPNSISSDITGNAATATRATTVDVTDTNSGTYRVVFSSAGTSQTLRSDTGITVQPGSNLIQASTFRGTLDGRADAAVGLSPKSGTGSHFNVTVQGMYTQWNRDSGTGSSYFINQKGGGAGGWRFVAADTGGNATTDVDVLLIEESGRVTIQGPDKTFVGNLSGNASSATNSANATNVSRQVIAGNGLTGGGTLNANRTLNVGAGSGISVAADTVAVDGTVVRTTGNQTISGTKTFNNTISGSISGNAASATNINVQGLTGGSAEKRILFNGGGVSTGNQRAQIDLDTAGVRYRSDQNRLLVGNLTVAGTIVGSITGSAASATNATNVNRQVIAGNGLTGGGTLNANRTLNVGAGSGISVAADTVAVDGTVVRTSGNQTISGTKTFSNTIVGNISGSAASATNATNTTNVNLASAGSNQQSIVLSSGTGTGNQRLRRSTQLQYNPNTNTLTVTNINVTNSLTTVDNSVTLSGNGSQITNINASNITSGTINDAYLPGTITSNITGSAASATNATNATNTTNFNILSNNTGSAEQRIVFVAGEGNQRGRIDTNAGGVRYLPSDNRLLVGKVEAQLFGNGSSITSLNASNLSSGTVSTARLSGTYSININGSAASSSNTTNSTNVNLRNSSTSGTVKWIVFNSGGNATGNRRLEIDNEAGGVRYRASDNRLFVDNISASSVGASFLSGNGSSITSLNASNLASGTVSTARLSGTYSININGNAASATNINVQGLTGGSAEKRILFNGGGVGTGNQRAQIDTDAGGVRYRSDQNRLLVDNISVGTISGSGSGLTNLAANRLSSGTVPTARLSGTYSINVNGNANTSTSATIRAEQSNNAHIPVVGANITWDNTGIPTNADFTQKLTVLKTKSNQGTNTKFSFNRNTGDVRASSFMGRGVMRAGARFRNGSTNSTNRRYYNVSSASFRGTNANSSSIRINYATVTPAGNILNDSHCGMCRDASNAGIYVVGPNGGGRGQSTSSCDYVVYLSAGSRINPNTVDELCVLVFDISSSGGSYTPA